MQYTKIKHYTFSQIKDYLNQYKNTPWIFYDIETTGLFAEEKLSLKNNKFWLTKPAQVTQISAMALAPSKTGRGLKEIINWNDNWRKVNPIEVFYKNNLSDMTSSKGEFNEKCMLNKSIYNQLTLEKLVQGYMSQFESADISLARKIHYSIQQSIKNDLKGDEISSLAKEHLELQLVKFNEMSSIFWKSSFQERRKMRKDFMSCLSRLTSTILKGTKKSILDATSYFDEHYPDGTEEELLINFNSFLADIKHTCECDKVLMVGQNNSGFDHRFIDTRMRKYLLKHNNNPEFDMRGITKYLLHPFIEKNRSTDQKCEALYKALFVERDDPKKSYLSARLGDLAKSFGIQADSWHNAIWDVRMTKDVFFNIMRFL